ncbi:MAG: hypothetical protein ACREH4_01290, partial [Vitreimonas sp.]
MTTVHIGAAAPIAVFLSLFACAPAKAQVFERPRPAPAETAQQTVPGRAATRADYADTSVRTPRFMVQMLRFEVIDETGSTDVGSDEVLVKYDTTAYWMTTSEFGDVDTGERRQIEPWQRCIYPARDPDDRANGIWECNNLGAPGPLNFTITLREQDTSLANVRVCLDFRAHRNDLVSPSDCTLSFTDAELIGSVTHQATVEQLVSTLPTEWTSHDFNIVLGTHNSSYRIFYT